MATAKSTTNSTTTKTKPNVTTTGPAPEQNDAVRVVRQSVERAVDVPVGAALTVRDRVSDVVEPWTSTEAREKELKSLRTQVTRELNRFERRGGQARRKANQRVRSTRNRVEREVKARRREVSKTVKQNRTKVQKAVKENRLRAEDALTKAQERVTELV